MDIIIDEMRTLYLQVIDEYNRSPMARAEKLVCEPNEEKFLELIECVKSLPSRHATFLDIGTGMGIAPRFFQKLGCRSITIDNPLSGGSGLRNIEAAGVTGIPCDILKEPLPLEDNSVDCVLFADVIEHLIHSPKFPLLQFRRVLKQSGVCVATTPNALRASVRLKVLLGASNWPHVGDYFDSPYHGGHHHEYTASEFRSVFLLAGFDVETLTLSGTVTSTKIGSLRELQSRSRAGSLGSSHTHPLVSLAKIPIYCLERAFPRLRPQMLLVARKP